MMTANAKPEQDAFQALLWSLYGQVAENDGLQKIRAKAWDHFLELGLPSRREEVYRYIKLRQLFSQSYFLSEPTTIQPEAIASHIYPESRQSVLVFVNGHYRPSLSHVQALPKRVVISTLKDATRAFGAFLNNQWAKGMKEESDPFAAVNAALHRDGLFVYIPPKTVVETPIQILNIVDAKEIAMMILPRVHLFVGTLSQLTLVTTSAFLSGEKFFINHVADMVLEEDAHVHYTQVACHESSEAWHFDSTRATLKRNSSLKTVSVTDGSQTVRHDYRVVLTGENAEALLNGMWMLNEKREAHTHVLMDHQAPYCRSMQLFKGVLDDLSRSSFEGKILVRQPAQKTDAFQLNNNLLLSDRANADSKPNLEIFADDVKASHGATVGQLDKEQIFYLKTRGFSEVEAKNLLVYGYCKEVIDMIPIPSLFKMLSQQVQSYVIKSASHR
jgi:Fe-S cluster assembly protein SufD